MLCSEMCCHSSTIRAACATAGALGRGHVTLHHGLPLCCCELCVNSDTDINVAKILTVYYIY